MPLIRFATALGLALLLVVGAWSTVHGEATAHASLCLASGATAADAAAVAMHDDDTAAPVDAPAPDPALTGFAMLWFLSLVLLLVHVRRRGQSILLPRSSQIITPPRAGPIRLPAALTLTELSLSRT